MNETIFEEFSGLKHYQFEIETSTDEMKRFQGGPILKHLVDNMMNVSGSSSVDTIRRRKLFLYSVNI